MTLRPPVACSGALLQQVAQCSGQSKQGRPSRGKVQMCEGGDQPGKQPKSKDQGLAESSGKEEPLSDCCGSAKGVQDAGSKLKAPGVCHESEDKFVKEAEDQEEACETSEGESDKECSSEEEDARAPIKECSDEEDNTSSCSDEDVKSGKAASEMCDCVKTAVANAVEQKAKEGVKPPQQKTLGQQGPCESTGKEPPKPKASEHVRCCDVEKGKNVLSGGKSAGEKCREERKTLDRARSSSQSEGQGSTPDTNKGTAKVDTKNQPCNCIKQALEKCKKGQPTPKHAISKQPDTKQPESVGKKPSEKPYKSSDDKKPSNMDKNKPDPKKPAPKSKQCEKKKKPVVICK